jgi:hypothetical protein
LVIREQDKSTPRWFAIRQLGLDRPWQVVAVVVLVSVIALAVAFGPLVRSVASSKAAARGLELEIGSIRPGWFALHLSDSVVRLAGVPDVSVKLEQIDVEVTPLFGLRKVRLEGGEFRLNGSVETLRERLTEWRAARPSRTADSSEGSSSRLELDGRRLSLTWTGADATGSVESVEGIRFERNAQRQRASFEKMRLEYSGTSLTVSLAEAAFASTPEGLALSSVKVAEVLGRLALNPSAEVTDTAAAATAVALPPAAGDPGGTDDPALIEDDPATAPPRSQTLVRLLAPLASQPWAARRAQLTELRRGAGRALIDGAQIGVERVQLEVVRGDSVLNVGPAPFLLARRGSLIDASLTPPAAKDGKQLTVTAELPLSEDPIQLRVEGGPISLMNLGVREGDFGLLGTDDSRLTLSTQVALSAEGALSISASGRLQRLAFEQAALAPEPLRDMNLLWGGEIQLDMSQRKLVVSDGVLGLGRARVQVGASLEAVGDDLKVDLTVQIPRTPCQDMLEAAPAALLPQLEGLRLGGTIALDSHVQFDTAAPKETAVEWELVNKCKVKEVPEAVDPRLFREPFEHLILDADGQPAAHFTGPTTEEWVPLSDITPNMETALIVCEDSRFFTHNGFDNKAIRSSISDNLKKGRFFRGASTLSMQLARNLYLSREKTMSRKLQEAAFTLLLEERLSKEDILELYLNVVEFGPGVYGIRNAASHYFNSHPGELSLGQAMYFGSILPNPKANHFAEDGTLRPRWAQHLRYLMKVAHKIKRISDDELEAGLAEQIVFGKAHPSTGGDFLFGTPIDGVSGG